jgi:hypothetical protein
METSAALQLQQQQQQALSDDLNHSPSPSILAPQNYVQQLASALGINATVAAPSTDFESLIELNRRQQQQQLNMSNVSAKERG